MCTVFQKNVTWLRPLFLDVKTLVPIDKIRRVKGFRTPPHQQVKTKGHCIFHGPKKITVTVRTHNENQSALTVEDVLFIFAHELAHVVHYEHTAAHLKLTARILQRFTKSLKKLGIRDTSSRKHPKNKV